MVNPSSQTNAATPEQELAALVSQVAALSKIALDMTRHCLDINEKLPRVVRAQVDAAIAEHTPATAFYEETAPTPTRSRRNSLPAVATARPGMSSAPGANRACMPLPTKRTMWKCH
ncbi:hypothetical protein B0H10DRAFT_1950603 [Mycena sp. CBHHK59/15]|nr:hypothetical protein B0H10DRAFT_1950603 [Mycena sp. CBHHK59/15]